VAFVDPGANLGEAVIEVDIAVGSILAARVAMQRSAGRDATLGLLAFHGRKLQLYGLREPPAIAIPAGAALGVIFTAAALRFSDGPMARRRAARFRNPMP
jgi:hypothetical protein